MGNKAKLQGGEVDAHAAGWEAGMREAARIAGNFRPQTINMTAGETVQAGVADDIQAAFLATMEKPHD